MSDTEAKVVGNATRDPELTFSNSGQGIAKFGVAVNTRKQDAGGNWVDGDTDFFDITAFGTLAENVAETITKGTRVVVHGRLKHSTWETKDGDKRSKVEVIADEVGPSLRWATAEVKKTERS